MKNFLTLLKKDFLLEFRSKENAVLIFSLALLLSVVVAFGAGSAFLDPLNTKKTFNTFLWLVLIFSATVMMGRTFEAERRSAAIEAVLLSGVAPGLLYLSKLAVNFLLVSAGQCAALIFLPTLLNVSLSDILPQYLLLSLLVIAGYTALSTLLAGISAASRLGSLLLPLILLPLLFPLFFSALELGAELVEYRALSTGSFWFTLLLALDLVYLILGVTLYEFVIRE